MRLRSTGSGSGPSSDDSRSSPAVPGSIVPMTHSNLESLPEAVPGDVARIRRARPDEAEHLTALTLRSKAHWGYDADFMAACVPSLTITSERIATPGELVFVAED